MLGLILGVMCLIAGLVLCTIFSKKEERDYKEDSNGNYMYDAWCSNYGDILPIS